MLRTAQTLAALVTVATTFRVKSPKHRPQQDRGAQGEVDGLYTYGAPATAKPALKDMRSDNPCFPGFRAAGVDSRLKQMDQVVWATEVFGYEHPWGDVMFLDVSDNSSHIRPCSKENIGKPNYFFKNPLLHVVYGQSNFGWNEFEKTMHGIGMKMNWVQIQWFAKQLASNVGYGLVASAYATGEAWIRGGLQVQHFVQNPETLECALTFQATLSLGDVVADLELKSGPFCGLPNRVHVGFRDHLRRMVSSDDWQKHIRPHLGSCSKVYATGTSLGGATAELFSACVNFAPSAENDPDGDYSQIGWSKGTPRKLPYV